MGQDLPLKAHFAIGNFIRDAVCSEQITVSGDGTALRTYLDQSDLAYWLWTLMFEGLDGQTYNIGSDRVISMSELACLVRDLLAQDKPIRILGEADPIASRNRYIPCIEKIYTLHGLRPRVTLENAILKTAHVFRSKSGFNL